MNALWSSLTDSSDHLIFRPARDAQSAVVVHADCERWRSLFHACVFAVLLLLCLCFCRWILAMQFLCYQSAQLMIVINVCFCVAGEGGHSEVYRDADVTDGSSGLCELQWDSAGRLPHHHLDDRTQELWRQKGTSYCVTYCTGQKPPQSIITAVNSDDSLIHTNTGKSVESF